MKAGATPADAKAVWDSLAEPSCRKVAAKLTAAGLSVSYKTVNKWRDAGWISKTAEQIEASASKSVDKINVALPAITGDVTSVLEDVAAKPNAEPTPDNAGGSTSDVPAQTMPVPAQSTQGAAEAAKPDTRTNIERAEDALLTAITGATTVWNSIRDLMAGVELPKGRALPPMMLAAQPEGIAKLMTAASDAISQAIEDSKQIPFLRAEAAAAIPGTQTMYPPGQGPHADADNPLRSAMEVFDAELKRIRERKT